MTLEERMDRIEERLTLLEVRIGEILEGLNESPKRTIRHRFGSIHSLHQQLGEVNDEFHRLVDELHRPSS